LSTTFCISGLYNTACFLATPGLVPTITDGARGFASDLLARLWPDGSWYLWVLHPLGNFDEFLLPPPLVTGFLGATPISVGGIAQVQRVLLVRIRRFQ